MTIGYMRRAKRGISENVTINIESDIDATGIAMCVDQYIVGDNIGDDIGLIVEELEESDGVVVALGAVHGGHDGVAGEDGGASVGEHGLAGDDGGVVEIAGADEGLNAVVEVEAGADEGGGGVGEAGGVGVGRRAGGVGVAAEGVEWGFDAEAAFTTAALSGCFFGGREGEGSDWEEEIRVLRVVDVVESGGCGGGERR